MADSSIIPQNINMEFDPSSCRQIGSIEEDGRIVMRDLDVLINRRKYELSVGEPSYAEWLRSYNKTVGSGAMLDDNIYTIKDFADLDLDEICRRVHTTPFDQLKPYLYPLNPEPQTEQS